jgi:hypothetical protein
VLPLILAGPVLRRTEPSRVCIWLATSAPVTVTATLWRHRDLREGAILGDRRRLPVVGTGKAGSVKLGERLYVALVIAKPQASAQVLADQPARFPLDEILSYDLTLIEDPAVPGSVSQDLGTLGLLEGPDRIVHAGLELPSFLLRGPRTPLHVLYASCRKLHAEGWDSLAAVDWEINERALAADRPSALFLTGDQIYADDVADAIIGPVTSLATELLGWYPMERIPGIDRDLSTIPLGGRQELVQKLAGFSSDAAGNHLLGFGEYAAMYLLAWNPGLWPDDQALAGDPELLRTKATVGMVRRALANVPTYMIFDDHEVTDDWNLNGAWYERVSASPTGRRIVTNALAAYWAFQALGDDPDAFGDGFGGAITDYLRSQGQSGGDELDHAIWVDARGWTFAAPTEPVTLFVDTRTTRVYDTSDGAARLVSEDGLALLPSVLERSGWVPGRPLLVVSPVPVYGIESVDWAAKLVAPLIGPYRYDLEAWAHNSRGFIDFLGFVHRELRPRYCVVLSGDVHYAFTISAAFSANGRGLPITQLTSSAAKNSGIPSFLALWEQPHTRHGWHTRPRSDKLERLEARARAARDPGLVRDLRDQVDRVRAVLNVQPVILADSELSYLGVDPASADWHETIAYHRLRPGDRTPILLANNVGTVTLLAGGTRLVHRLLGFGLDGPTELRRVDVDAAPVLP